MSVECRSFRNLFRASKQEKNTMQHVSDIAYIYKVNNGLRQSVEIWYKSCYTYFLCKTKIFNLLPFQIGGGLKS